MLDIFVETLIDEISDKPAALRCPEYDRPLDGRGPSRGARKRVAIRDVVPEERDEVSNRRESDPHDDRVLGFVDEVVGKVGREAIL